MASLSLAIEHKPKPRSSVAYPKLRHFLLKTTSSRNRKKHHRSKCPGTRMKISQMIHQYAGVHGLQRSCGVEIFANKDEIPIVVISQLEDVEGSVSILFECIAAEILENSLKKRIGSEMPFRCIEHYPREEGSALSETFDLVTFADYEVRPRNVRGVPRLSFGRPSRAPLGRKQVEAMIQGPYVWSFSRTRRRSHKSQSRKTATRSAKGRRDRVTAKT
jgi:hypothetical protein